MSKFTASKGRSCDGKQRFESAKAAEAQRGALIRRAGVAHFRIGVYRCKHCDGWHVGHTSKSRRKKF